jgi:hypothetical protein
MTTPEFMDFQQQNRVFADSMGVTEESVLLKESGQLKEFDAEPDAPPVFVLNYRVWKQDFNADPHVIGKTFNLNGTPTTLVGVMPPRFAFWDGNLWRPLPLHHSDKEHHIAVRLGAGS